MKILIKNAYIVDDRSPYHRTRQALFINNGTIQQIDQAIEPTEDMHLIEGDDLNVSNGLFDMRVDFADPGYEYREDLNSGMNAAIAGGFTSVGLLPATAPLLSTKSQIEYIKGRTAQQTLNVLPYATISKDLKSKEITEMVDLQQAGAVAFTEGNQPIADSGLLKRAMLYTLSFDGLIIVYSEDPSLSENGVINEGWVNVALGLEGRPTISEHISIAKDLELCRYTGGRIHFSKLSTARSVQLIRAAKNEGLPVTADVSAFHLYFQEDALQDFNSNFKFLPPLRTGQDVAALKNGVIDGTIDAIVSDHTPLEEEQKKCEFQNAGYGAIGIQTMLPIIQQVFKEEKAFDQAIKALTEGPRRVLKIDPPKIEVNQQAELTVFSSDQTWTMNTTTNRSKSRNSPLWNETLTGQPLAIINGNAFEKVHANL